MSRVGNKVITLLDGVSVLVGDNNHVEVNGPKGKLEYTFPKEIEIVVEGTSVHVKRPSDSIKHRSLHGTVRSVLSNMVEGVAKEFSKILDIKGTGYRASLKGETLVVNAGYSHLVELPVPSGLRVVVPSQVEIQIYGCDLQSVGQFAAEVRAVRKPEPYLGKGISYRGEVIRRKEGKKAK
jgi:large subunit ribosomal protein L6